jgi:hypothetical protein
MAERVRLWSFHEGMLGPDDSVKDFRVEATDGHAGKVSWASYAAGESYLVVSHMQYLETSLWRRHLEMEPGVPQCHRRTSTTIRTRWPIS